MYGCACAFVNPLVHIDLDEGNMRTTKRFSPAVLDRFLRQERGTGTGQEYIPWHQVSRGDPSSSGRSHWHIFRNRQEHLLSDVEQTCLHFITMMAGVEDCREQYPLSIEASTHALLDYGFGNPLKLYPGTREIAQKLGYRHPKTHGDGASCEWVQTTDLLVALNLAHHPTAPTQKSLLAISVKPKSVLSKRARQLLSIERSYWHARGAEWILFTPELFALDVKKTLEEISPWTTTNATMPHAAQQLAATLAKEHRHKTLRSHLTVLECRLGSEMLAQQAFWQAVWNGLLPLDLKYGVRPTRPLKLLDPIEFTRLNPVACRRSSWNS